MAENKFESLTRIILRDIAGAIAVSGAIVVSGVHLVSAAEPRIDGTIGRALLTADSRTASADIERADEESGKAISDSWITTQVKARLFADDDIGGLNINVSTSGGDVALAGIVPSDAVRERAILIAHRIDGVHSVNARALAVEEQ